KGHDHGGRLSRYQQERSVARAASGHRQRSQTSQGSGLAHTNRNLLTRSFEQIRLPFLLAVRRMRRDDGPSTTSAVYAMLNPSRTISPVNGQKIFNSVDE